MAVFLGARCWCDALLVLDMCTCLMPVFSLTLGYLDLCVFSFFPLLPSSCCPAQECGACALFPLVSGSSEGVLMAALK